MNAVECVGLTKLYEGQVLALDDLTLEIPAGLAFGLLGENGAGKSTLVRLLLGFLTPTDGEVRVLGERDVTRAHPRIGYVHERPIFEPRFTAREYLGYCAELSGLWGRKKRARVGKVLEWVHLEEAADRRVGGYSKGMLQRLSIAQALLNDPELLILDEVTSGIDAGSQWEVRQMIGALHAQGKTVLLCSHYLAEVEALCDAVAILRKGTLVLTGSVETLLRSHEAVEIALEEGTQAREVVQRLGLGDVVSETRGALLRLPASAQPEVLAALVAGGVPIRSLNPLSQSLEEVYMRATRPAEEAAGVAFS
ncbi:MAG TPA: ABC transporter ATP-binding protein [Ktedonobacterales bacterium]|jgi:ABC-2 type transport system ATP-binding protein